MRITLLIFIILCAILIYYHHFTYYKFYDLNLDSSIYVDFFGSLFSQHLFIGLG